MAGNREYVAVQQAVLQSNHNSLAKYKKT